MHIALRLLLNLSFDTNIQLQMANAGLIPKLVDLMTNETEKNVVLKLLYHLSMTDKSKSLFTFTDCIPMVMKMVLETPADQFVTRELIALAVNLASLGRNAEIMAEGEGLKMLMARAKKTGDPILMKMIRNISQHDECKEQFLVRRVFSFFLLTIFRGT